MIDNGELMFYAQTTVLKMFEDGYRGGADVGKDTLLLDRPGARAAVSTATLDRNRAKALEALRLAESRTGVKCQSYRQRLEVEKEPVTSAYFPIQPKLACLFPERRVASGSVISVQHGVSLLFGLLAAASQCGIWVSFVGMPGLGLLAASQAGLALERVAVIPHVGVEAGEVVGVLLDVMCVVVGPKAVLSVAERRRLAARARERGTVLFATGEWPGANLSFDVLGYEWSGFEHGRGWVQRTHAHIRRLGRGAAAVPRTFDLELPLVWES